MRWQRLFADLEAQLGESERLEQDAEIADRTRRELARVRLGDRLRGAAGSAVELRVLGAGVVRAVVGTVGPDWLLAVDSTGAEIIVPIGALTMVGDIGRHATPPAKDRIDTRIGLGHLLRGVARDRAEVVVIGVDGMTITGTVDRVGADFADLSTHARGEPRRSGSAAFTLCVPFAGIGLVRRT